MRKDKQLDLFESNFEVFLRDSIEKNQQQGHRLRNREMMCYKCGTKHVFTELLIGDSQTHFISCGCGNIFRI